MTKPLTNWITLKEAAKATPYSPEYLGLLARTGKIDAKKIGRDWLTTKEAMDLYLEKFRKFYDQT